MSCRRGNDIYPPQFLAKKLNNRASFFITIRDYDRGIELLTEALQLTQKNFAAEQKRRPCLLKCCMLETSLAVDDESFACLIDSEREGCIGNKCSGKCQPLTKTSSECDEYMECDQDYTCLKCHRRIQSSLSESYICYERGEGFVFNRPFLVDQQSIEEGHYMGLTLSLMIIFNLALAHHLKATSYVDDNSKSNSLASQSPSITQVLEQALQLYELSYQLHIDYVQKISTQPSEASKSKVSNRNIGSLRFSMIVSNNVGEIHRVVGNFAKHKMCLEHLLSAIMYMVDCNVADMDSAEMDGFYHNVATIVTKDNCAKAA